MMHIHFDDHSFSETETTIIGIALLILASIGFGVQGILAKLIYQENIDVLTLLLLRTLMITPLFWALALIRLPKSRLFPHKKHYIIASMAAGFIGFYVAPLSDLNALELIDSGVARIIYYTFPAFVIILNAIIHNRFPPKTHIAAFLFIQLGVFLVMGAGNSHEVQPHHVYGVLWALFAAFIFSTYVQLNQHITKNMGSLSFILYAVTGSCIAITFHFFSSEPISNLSKISSHGFLLTVSFAAVTFIPILAFAEGVKRIGAPRAALVTMISPIITVAGGILFLGESLSPLQWLGSIIVLGTVILLEIKVLHVWLRYRKQHKKSQNTP